MKTSRFALLFIAVSTPALATDYSLDVSKCTFRNFSGDTSAISLPTNSRYSGLLKNGAVLSLQSSNGELELAYANAFAGTDETIQLLSNGVQGRQVNAAETSAFVHDNFGDFWKGSSTKQSWSFEMQDDGLVIKHSFRSLSPFMGATNYSYSCRLGAL